MSALLVTAGTSPSAPQLLKVHQVAYVLNVSEPTVRRLCQTRVLRARKVGTDWRVFPGSLHDYLAEAT